MVIGNVWDFVKGTNKMEAFDLTITLRLVILKTCRRFM